jgi:hypothetical protein
MISLFIAFDIAERHIDKMEDKTMVTLNAQIIKKEGKKEYAVIPYEEFLMIQEDLHNYEDLRCLREAKQEKGVKSLLLTSSVPIW